MTIGITHDGPLTLAVLLKITGHLQGSQMRAFKSAVSKRRLDTLTVRSGPVTIHYPAPAGSLKVRF